MTIKIKSLDIIVYTENIDDLVRSFINTPLLSSFDAVSQIMIVLNSNDKTYPQSQSHKKIQVLLTKEKLSQGAALNKALPHLWSDRTLILDHRLLASIDLKRILDYDFPFLAHSLVNIPLESHSSSLYCSHQSYNSWESYKLQLISFVLWGAVIVENSFIFSMGGFDDRLCFDDLMVDLSMRSHKRQAVVIQLNDIKPLPYIQSSSVSSSANDLIKSKYFVEQTSLWSRFCHWLKTLSRRPSSKTTKLLPPVEALADDKFH